MLVVYSQAGKSFIFRIWDSAPVLQIRDLWKEGVVKLTVFVEATKVKILNAADLRGVYQALLNVFSKKCKTILYYC